MCELLKAEPSLWNGGQILQRRKFQRQYGQKKGKKRGLAGGGAALHSLDLDNVLFFFSTLPPCFTVSVLHVPHPRYQVKEEGRVIPHKQSECVQLITHHYIPNAEKSLAVEAMG